MMLKIQKVKINLKKVKSMDDRRKLMQLLQLSEPLENTIKSYHDKKSKGLITSNNNIDPNSISLSKNLGLSSFSNKSNKNKLLQNQDSLKKFPHEEIYLIREELEIYQINSKNLVKNFIKSENLLRKSFEKNRRRQKIKRGRMEITKHKL